MRRPVGSTASSASQWHSWVDMHCRPIVPVSSLRQNKNALWRLIAHVEVQLSTRPASTQS